MARINLNLDDVFERVNAREVYGKRLAELGATHPEIVVLTADLLKSNKLGDFKAVFPERFFNVGIAEADMMGIAAGLALDGKVPFVSTFATFASMRAHEQVRTDIAYVNLPVKIIATTAGLTGGTLGPTHQGTEDIGTMRMMPNMTVIAPGDPLQMRDFIDQALELPGPVYIRVGRGDDPVSYGQDQPVRIGKAITARSGSDLTIIACGTIVSEAITASDRLRESGMDVRVIDMHTIKPIDVEAILAAADETGRIITAEDHLITGGLGSAVAEVLAESGIPVRQKRLGVPDVFAPVGKTAELYEYFGLDARGIEASVREFLDASLIT